MNQKKYGRVIAGVVAGAITAMCLFVGLGLPEVWRRHPIVALIEVLLLFPAVYLAICLLLPRK